MATLDTQLPPYLAPGQQRFDEQDLRSVDETELRFMLRGHAYQMQEAARHATAGDSRAEWAARDRAADVENKILAVARLWRDSPPPGALSTEGT